VPLFLEAGLDGVLSHPKTLVSSDLGVADGRFFTSYTGFLVSGTRPVC
jgi:hypothetical protein